MKRFTASKTNANKRRGQCVFFAVVLLCLCAAGCGNTAAHTNKNTHKVRTLDNVLYSGGSVFRLRGAACVEWVAKPERSGRGGHLITALIDEHGFRHGLDYRHIRKETEIVLAGGGKTPMTRKAQDIGKKGWGLIGVARMCLARELIQRVRAGVYLIGKERWFMSRELCRNREKTLQLAASDTKTCFNKAR